MNALARAHKDLETGSLSLVAILILFFIFFSVKHIYGFLFNHLLILWRMVKIEE